MVRKYEYISNKVPSEDFSGLTDGTNEIDTVDLDGIGVLRCGTHLYNGKGAGSTIYTKWISVRENAWVDDEGVANRNAIPGRWVRIRDDAQEGAELGRFQVLATGTTYDDGGFDVFRLYGHDWTAMNQALSGDYLEILRPHFAYDRITHDYSGSNIPLESLESLEINTLLNYKCADIEDSLNLTASGSFDCSGIGDFVLSSTKAYDGSWSYRLEAPTSAGTHEAVIPLWDESTSEAPATRDRVFSNMYIKFYLWNDVSNKCSFTIYLAAFEGGGAGREVGFGRRKTVSATKYVYYIDGSWDASDVDLVDSGWALVEFLLQNGEVTVLVDSKEVISTTTSAGKVYQLVFEVENCAAGAGDSYTYIDGVEIHAVPEISSEFTTVTLKPEDSYRISRWESLLANYAGQYTSGTDYGVKVTAYDENDNLIELLQGANLESGYELSLTDLDAWSYRRMKLKFELLLNDRTYETITANQNWSMSDYTLKYSRGPDAVSLICELNSGDNPYDDVSPNSQIDTEATALSTWRSRYDERTHSVFDILFDWGDGHNTGWQTGEKHAHVYTRACETGYSDYYYPFFIARDQYGGISASGAAVNLSVQADDYPSGNYISVQGDYEEFGQHSRLWARTGAAKDNFYHVEDAVYNLSAGTTTFTLDDHYDIDADGIVAGDRIDVIDVLLGDFDGANDSFHVQSHKVTPTALLRGRPIVAVSGSTVVFDGSESFTPNDEEAITNYYFDSGDDDTSAGTLSSYSHMYGTPATYNPTLYVADSGLTGAVKNSPATSLTIMIQTAEDAGTPEMADVYDLRANLHNQPSEFAKSHESIFQDSEALAGGYPTFIDTEKKGQDVIMKGMAKPLKHYAGATTIQKDAGELDILTLGTIWKNKTIFKYKYRETRLSGASDEKWFVGRIVDFTWSESGGRPHHYEWTAQCHYVHGIAEASQEI